MWKRNFHVRLDAHAYVAASNIADDIDIGNHDDLHRQRI